jgi:hypothetical protein
MSFVRKRKTARPWEKRGVQGTELLRGIDGAYPKVEYEKKKVRMARKAVSQNDEDHDQIMFEQFLRTTWADFIRIPSQAYEAVFGPRSPLSATQKAIADRYMTGLPDTTVFFHIGDTPYLLARCIEQKVKRRALNHRQQLRATIFATTKADTVEEAIQYTEETRAMRDRIQKWLSAPPWGQR